MAKDVRVQIAQDVASFYDDPLGFVMYAFPWDSDESIQQVELSPKYKAKYGCDYGPDDWACEFLDEWGDEIRKRGFDGKNAVEPIQFSTSSGHGIGKSTLTSWIILFIMSTRPYCKGVVTANTAEQLKTKTWAELGKWFNNCITKDWFDYNTGRGAMSLSHKAHKTTWRVDAQTSRAENSEAFAGLHAANSTPFYVFDEASAVPDIIFEVREGGTTDGEPMTFDFGNPTRNSGKFFENCAGAFRHRYIHKQIDSRNVKITSKDRIKQWEEDYGADSDFFKVRVKGEFPSAGSLQFMPTNLVEEAMMRADFEDKDAQLIIGVDVARFGDDESIIWPRLGMDARSWPIRRFLKLDTVQLTGKIIECIREFRAIGKECAALFIDGTGIGGGVVDQLRHLGYNPIEIQFGSSAIDSQVYRYRMDEMWGRTKDALPRLLLPPINAPNGLDIKSDLTKREYGYTTLGNKIQLESKKEMKERGLQSPNLADALALTFAQDVAPPPPAGLQSNQNNQAESEYDPLETSW
jgi:hypothetical protein